MNAIMNLKVLLAFTAGLTLVTQTRADACGGLQGVYICNPMNPTLFDICIGDQKYTMSCPGGLHFNTRTQICDWPRNADCGQPATVPTPGYRELQTNPSNPDPVEEGEDKSYDYDESTSRPVTVRHLGPNDLRKENDDFHKVPHTSDPRYKLFHSKEHDSVEQEDDADEQNSVDNSRRSSSRFGRKRPNRFNVPRKSSRGRSGKRQNPYLYTGSKGEKHRQMVLQQKMRNERIRKKYRKTQDGYDKNTDNFNRKGKKPSTRRRWWQKNEDDKKNENSINNDDDNSNKVSINDNNMVQNNDDRKVGINDKRSENNMGTNKKNIYVATSDSRTQANANNQNNANSMNNNNANNNNQNAAVVEASTTSQDRFSLAHFPWWTSKSATPRVLRQKFALPTPKPPSTANKNQAKRRPVSRRQRPVSSAAASGSRRSGLAPSFAPAAKAPKPKQQQNVPPQQPMSAKKSITAAAASAPKRTKKPKKTGKCSEDTCKLPDCRCVGSDIPGGIPLEDTPQMVMLTFDDSVNVANFDYYTKLFDGKFRNPNGCPVKGTFFVSGDATQYHFVEKLYKRGQEIASHSISHRSPTTYWAHAGYDGYVSEIEGMRKKLSEKSKIPRESIQGMRVPFLQVGGDDQYQMLEDFDYRYDTSMVTGHLYRNENPPVWPFTLDYPPSSKHCSLTPCPTKSYPGLWEVPLVRWYGSNRLACAMPDGCTIGGGQKGTYKFLMDNFNRHYTTNKSPLGIFLHASWFRRKDGNLEGLMQFLEEMNERKDVWVISVSQVLDWIQNPIPNNMAGSIATWSCDE